MEEGRERERKGKEKEEREEGGKRGSENTKEREGIGGERRHRLECGQQREELMGSTCTEDVQSESHGTPSHWLCLQSRYGGHQALQHTACSLEAWCQYRLSSPPLSFLLCQAGSIEHISLFIYGGKWWFVCL